MLFLCCMGEDMERFDLDIKQAQEILRGYGLLQRVAGLTELLRYHYDEGDNPTDEVRLILRAELDDREPVVIKLLREKEYPASVMEAQAAFSEMLRRHGVPTARHYAAGKRFVTLWNIMGREIQVTVEDFVKGQLQIINVETARQIGRMHARAHEISLREDCHVDYPVLFDALGENDLFSFAMLEEQLTGMPDPLRGKAEDVLALCHDHQAALSPLAAYPRCATQGDLSDCNLYRTSDGEIGMFDFNNCGDAVPLVDAIMQGIFVSRLMDYGQEPTEVFSLGLLRAYLEGYESIRPLTAQEKELARHMDALCAALWRFDLVFGDDSLKNLLVRGDMAGADVLLDELLRRAQWRRPLFQGA